MTSVEAPALRLADLLAPLSVANDLGVGRRDETAMLACLLACRLADLTGVEAAQRSDIYYATLLR